MDRLARARIEIDVAAIVRNARAVAARSGARLIPMVKADAYGVGVGPIVLALEELDPWGYGVATVPEGEELRALGIGRPVVVFTPLVESDLRAARAALLTPALGTIAGIEAWRRAGGGAWQLAIDTGMLRAGIAWREAAALKAAVQANPPEGAFTHFHSAEISDGSAEEQDRRLDQALETLGIRPALIHSENSAAIVLRARSSRDAVRPGIFLYGGATVPGAALIPEPVVHMRAPIVEIRDAHAGDTVSYGATHLVERPSRIATLSVGYADGYPRNVGQSGRRHGRVLIGGRVTPMVGRVTMDMIMIDVTGADVAIGDVATLMGRDGNEVITVAEVGEAAGISPYEVLTGLRNRTPRVYGLA